MERFCELDCAADPRSLLHIKHDGSAVWRGEKFDDVVVGVAQEDLDGAVGAGFGRSELSVYLAEMSFPFGKVVHAEGEMIPTAVGYDGGGALANEVEFLLRTKAKPCSGKVEGRAREGFQTESITVEIAGGFEVFHVEGDVIEFENLHGVVIEILPRECNEELRKGTLRR